MKSHHHTPYTAPNLLLGQSLAHTHHVSISSTNDALITAITDGTHPDDIAHVYTADTQTKGRGQHGNTWQSPIGNVYLSLYVPMARLQSTGMPTYHLHRLTGALSLCIGFCLSQTPIITAINATRQTQNLPPIQVKWANDLVLYHSHIPPKKTQDCMPFMKLAGILIEPIYRHSKQLGVVIGIGMNIATAPTIASELYQALSLQTLTSNGLGSLTPLYQEICDAIFEGIVIHNHATYPYRTGVVLDDTFIKAFNDAHALHQKTVGIYHSSNLSIDATPEHIGICTGINADGSLSLQTKHGTLAIFAGSAKRLYDLYNKTDKMGNSNDFFDF